MELYETISLQCETLCNSHTYFTIYRSEVRWAVAAPAPAVPLSPHTTRMEKVPGQRCVSMCGFDIRTSFFSLGSVRFIDVGQVMVIVSLNSKCRCRRANIPLIAAMQRTH